MYFSNIFVCFIPMKISNELFYIYHNNKSQNFIVKIIKILCQTNMILKFQLISNKVS